LQRDEGEEELKREEKETSGKECAECSAAG
jgi:hypothetical protein